VTRRFNPRMLVDRAFEVHQQVHAGTRGSHMTHMNRIKASTWARAATLGIIISAVIVGILAAATPDVSLFAGSSPALATTPASANGGPAAAASNSVAMTEDKCPGCPLCLPWTRDDDFCCICRILAMCLWLLGEDFPGGTDPTTLNANLEYMADVYLNNGFPSGLTTQEKQDGIEALNNLEDVLTDEPLLEGIDEDIAATVLALIPDMIDDLD